MVTVLHVLTPMKHVCRKLRIILPGRLMKASLHAVGLLGSQNIWQARENNGQTSLMQWLYHLFVRKGYTSKSPTYLPFIINLLYYI